MSVTGDVFDALTWGWIGLGVGAFILLQFVDAPYGRRASATWGPQVPNKLGWVVMEAVVLVALVATMIGASAPATTTTVVMVGLFVFHYLNRAFIYPFRTRTTGKKMPVAILASSVAFNTINGLMIGYYFAHFASYPASWFTDPRFIVGTLLFVAGLALNWHSDGILIGLRRPGETGYRIPHGGAFRWVSAPNLLGELIEWIGFAVLTWSLPALSFAIWTAANVIPRARANHRWYLEHFPDYPPERKALIPGLL